MADAPLTERELFQRWLNHEVGVIKARAMLARMEEAGWLPIRRDILTQLYDHLPRPSCFSGTPDDCYVCLTRELLKGE